MKLLDGLRGMFERKNANPDWTTLERYLAWAFGGGASSSGIIVNPQTAMQSAAVYSCVQVLSQTIGMLPLNVWQGDDTKTLAKKHSLWKLLHDQPNSYQTSVEFFEMMVLCLCLRGNAYAYITRTRTGRVVELIPMHPDMVRVIQNPDSTISYQITMSDGSSEMLTNREIFHVRGMTLNGWLGISPIAYARESIGLALATEKFGGQLFRNGAKMGGVLEHPGKIGDEAYKRIKESFDTATSGENAHKTALLEEGMKFSKVTMNADDAQFLETRKYQRSEIAAIFRVPPHMIGDLEKATFSNIEQQSLEFVTFTLMPWLVRFEKAIKRDLIDPKQDADISIKFNVGGLLRGDAAARSTYYHNGILDGWLTRNEARKAESDIGNMLNPLEGLDIPLMPLNMTDGTDDPDEAEDEAEGEPENDKPAGQTAEQQQEANEKFLDAIRNIEIKNTINVPQPIANVTIEPANVNVTIEKGGKVEFQTDNQGNITGATL